MIDPNLASREEVHAFAMRLCGQCGRPAASHIYLYGTGHYACPTIALFTEPALPGAVPAHGQLVRDTEEAFGIVQRILGFDVVGDDPDDWIIALRELEKRMAVGLGVMALPRVCASCDHLQSFELTDEIKTCPVLNIRIATQEIQTFGCSLYEPTALPGAVPAQEQS